MIIRAFFLLNRFGFIVAIQLQFAGVLLLQTAKPWDGLFYGYP